MISLSLIEVLYVVIIVAIIVLTVYLATTLSKLKAVLEDVQHVSHLLSNTATVIEKIGAQAMPALTGLIAVVETFAKKNSANKTKKAKK